MSVLLALALGRSGADGPKARLDPLALGVLGFRAVNSGNIAQASGFALSGLPLTVNVAPTRPAILYFFSAHLASTRAVLAGLENLRMRYAGRLGFVAISSDLQGEVGAAVQGLALTMPLITGSGIAPSLGIGRAPGFLVVAPGGWIIAKREGAFDWDSESGRGLLDQIIGIYPDASPELFGMPGQVPASPNSPFALGALEAKAAADPARDLRLPAWLTPLESAVVEELNLARTRPAEYADILTSFQAYVKGGFLELPGRVAVKLAEGGGAIREAIAFLGRQPALPALAISKGLSMSARDQAMDQGKSGATGHGGSDLSTPFARMDRYGTWQGTAGENCSYGPDTAREIVIALIVDDGVTSRGHRANIFSRDFLRVGVAVASHPVYGTVCVQDFAWSYADK